MKVKILRKTSVDLLLEGDDISIDLDNSNVLIIEHNTYTSGYARPTTLVVPWHEISELNIFR